MRPAVEEIGDLAHHPGARRVGHRHVRPGELEERPHRVAGERIGESRSQTVRLREREPRSRDVAPMGRHPRGAAYVSALITWSSRLPACTDACASSARSAASAQRPRPIAMRLRCAHASDASTAPPSPFASSTTSENSRSAPSTSPVRRSDVARRYSADERQGSRRRGASTRPRHRPASARDRLGTGTLAATRCHRRSRRSRRSALGPTPRAPRPPPPIGRRRLADERHDERADHGDRRIPFDQPPRLEPPDPTMEGGDPLAEVRGKLPEPAHQPRGPVLVSRRPGDSRPPSPRSPWPSQAAARRAPASLRPDRAT